MKKSFDDILKKSLSETIKTAASLDVHVPMPRAMVDMEKNIESMMFRIADAEMGDFSAIRQLKTGLDEMKRSLNELKRYM